MPKLCAFDKHPLKNGVFVTDPIYIPFIHKTRPEFRPQDEVCRRCRNTMVYMYEKKKQNARELQESRKRLKVSTLSSNSTDSLDSFRRLVYKTAHHKRRREEDDVPLASITSSQSSIIIYGGSPDGINEESQSRSKKNETNILLESRIQSSYESHGISGASNNKTKTHTLQKNRSVLSVTSEESANLSQVTVIRKKLTFNSAVSIPEPKSSRAAIINRDSSTEFTPTICQYNFTNAENLNVRLSQAPSTSAAAVKAKTIVPPKSTDSDSRNILISQEPSTSAAAAKANDILQKQRTPVQVTAKSTDGDSLNVLTSQEPSTSAATAKAKGMTQKQSTAAKVATPKSRGIRDYFIPTEVNDTNTNNISIMSDSSSSDAPTAPTITGRTDQPSTSSRQRLSNSNVAIDDDTNDDSDDEPLMSLNYYNPEVRFPQYQPIPRRRQFNNANKRIMDIYIKNLIGG